MFEAQLLREGRPPESKAGEYREQGMKASEWVTTGGTLVPHYGRCAGVGLYCGARRVGCSPAAILLGAMLLFVTSGCATPKDATEAQSRWENTRLCSSLKLAEEHVAAGKYERARNVLVAYADYPDPRVQLTQARMEIEEGKHTIALHRLNTIAPPPAEAATYRRLRGMALAGLGRWAEAAAAYEQAYQHEPTVPLLAAWLDALVLEGRIVSARTILERERYRFPDHPAVHMLTARLCEQSDNSEVTISEPTAATVAKAHSFNIRRRLAEMYTAAGRYSEAIVIWRQLVNDSGSADERHRLRRRLADCLMSANRFEEARRVFRTLVVTQPDDQQVLLGLATACLMTGESAEALQAALKVLKTDNGNGNARLIAGFAYQRLNRPYEAVELLSDIRSDDDPDGLVRELLARWE